MWHSRSSRPAFLPYEGVWYLVFCCHLYLIASQIFLCSAIIMWFDVLFNVFICPKPPNKFSLNFGTRCPYYIGTDVRLFVRNIRYGTCRYSNCLNDKAGRRRINLVRLCVRFQMNSFERKMYGIILGLDYHVWQWKRKLENINQLRHWCNG
jgi:hypothetical protein